MQSRMQRGGGGNGGGKDVELSGPITVAQLNHMLAHVPASPPSSIPIDQSFRLSMLLAERKQAALKPSPLLVKFLEEFEQRNFASAQEADVGTVHRSAELLTQVVQGVLLQTSSEHWYPEDWQELEFRKLEAQEYLSSLLEQDGMGENGIAMLSSCHGSIWHRMQTEAYQLGMHQQKGHAAASGKPITVRQLNGMLALTRGDLEPLVKECFGDSLAAIETPQVRTQAIQTIAMMVSHYFVNVLSDAERGGMYPATWQEFDARVKLAKEGFLHHIEVDSEQYNISLKGCDEALMAVYDAWARMNKTVAQQMVPSPQRYMQ